MAIDCRHVSTPRSHGPRLTGFAAGPAGTSCAGVGPAISLFFAPPWSLRRVPDVDDHDLVAVNTVVHSVRGGSDPKRIQVAAVGLPAAVGIVLQRAYSSDDAT